MTEICPVCGDRVEHVRVESGEDGTSGGVGGAGSSDSADGNGTSGDAGEDATTGGTATFDIDGLCSAADDTRWDRICAAATTNGDEDGDGDGDGDRPEPRSVLSLLRGVSRAAKIGKVYKRSRPQGGVGYHVP